MASTSKAFKKCVDPRPRYLRWHTQSLRLLFGQGARTQCPWGENLCALWAFSIKSSAPVLSLFSRKEGQPSASRDSGPTAAEAQRRMKLAVGYGRWVREGPPLFARVGREWEWAAELWRSFWHHQIQRLVLCKKSRRCLRARKLRLNPLNPSALHMNEFWRLWIIKINLSGHKSPARASLPFFINLDVEVEKEWKKLFFLVFIGFSILVMLTLRGCVKMAMRGCPLCKRW